jgi:hypothetical protein
MKKLLAFIFLVCLLYLYLNGKCVAFGYDNIVISKELLCAKSTVSDAFQYEITSFTPLRELEGDAKEYIPLPPPTQELEKENA